MCKILYVPTISIINKPDFRKYFYGDSFSESLRQEYRSKLNNIRSKGHVDGDWDLSTISVCGPDSFYTAMLSYLKTGSFEDTNNYKICLSRFGKKNTQYKFDNWVKVYHYIEKNGYHVLPCADKDDEYITICIGRNGELLFHNGIHRLSICLLLGIETIPVKVAFRHTKWYKFRNIVLDYARSKDDCLYAPVDHPDLDFSSTWNRKDDDVRLKLILDNISSSSKNVLDIGTHWGRIAFHIAKTNRVCDAVEYNEKYFKILDRLNIVYGNPVRTHHTDILSFLKSTSIRYDCMIAMSIFHHFMKPHTWKYFLELFPYLKCKEMFLQVVSPDTIKNKNICVSWDTVFSKLYDIGLTDSKKIGRVHDRDIYHLRASDL